ncbi:efflux RND transporter periplasmic adaptor subunit [Permianibacter aggregans]|uniref:RND family efflux transporter MFP subunit n=1 Tax=Permianibacter aggregans TaxID=1510150 RepID=A0A4R6UD49_9GAMM|nr:HlyD family efflux transporter periplasmic adaptor subunit [Permianibacter aggregans]QGX39052.1 HlyD family efflux transporter periplasmic adaptor subunit [Permianibacter aggregans]TDQ44608.1 RND family efflux transporter MFP subunit [Permianibacter aggregans]
MNRLNVSTLILTLVLSATSVFGHGGEEHSHGDETPATSTANTSARLALEGEQLEAVLVYSETPWQLYLDDRDRNAPVDAELNIDLDGQTLAVERVDNGSYQLAVPENSLGKHSIVIAVTSEQYNELLLADFTVSADQEAAHQHWSWWWLTLLLVPLAGWLFWRKRQAATAVLIMTFVGASTDGFAHGDEQHSHESELPTTLGSASPMRLPDGQLFVPKPSQRLMNVRTEKTALDSHTLSYRLNAQVIADPSGSGLVQATQTGRVLPAGKRLPQLGAEVKAGAVLAYLEPVLSQGERASLQAEHAQVQSQLQLAEQRWQRLQQIRDSVPRKEWEAAQADVDALRVHATSLQQSLHAKLPLTAPVSGVISDVKIVAGAIADTGQTLFEIVTPKAFLVEALAFDEAMAAQIKDAVFVHQGNEYALSFIGAGRKLRDQAVPVQFRLREPAERLSVGAIGSALVVSGQQQSGVLVPQSALLRGDDGRQMLVIKLAPEIFALRAVEAQAQPNATALVTSGLQGGERVVVSGASLLQQVR